MDYQLNSFVNKKEAEALKELIFKRVKERAGAMTSDVQTDIMNVARESFVSTNNPFSQIVTQSVSKQDTKEIKQPPAEAVVSVPEEKPADVGFPVKDFTGIVNQNKMI